MKATATATAPASTTRTGPKPLSKGESFGLVRDENDELKIPDFESLDFEIKKQAVYIFATAVGMSVAEATDFAMAYQEDLPLLYESGRGIKYWGLKTLFEDLYTAAGKKFRRQRSSKLKRSIEEMLSLGKQLSKNVCKDGIWPVKAAGLYLGSVGCSVTESSSATRSYLPLVGALLILKYQELLIVGLEPERTDAEPERTDADFVQIDDQSAAA